MKLRNAILAGAVFASAFAGAGQAKAGSIEKVKRFEKHFDLQKFRLGQVKDLLKKGEYEAAKMLADSAYSQCPDSLKDEYGKKLGGLFFEKAKEHLKDERLGTCVGLFFKAAILDPALSEEVDSILIKEKRKRLEKGEPIRY